jgi:hypothetical protein
MDRAEFVTFVDLTTEAVGEAVLNRAGEFTSPDFHSPPNGNAGSQIAPQPRVGNLVELRGVEPLTPRLPALCSPN